MGFTGSLVDIVCIEQVTFFYDLDGLDGIRSTQPTMPIGSDGIIDGRLEIKNVHADDSVRLETEPTGPGAPKIVGETLFTRMAVLMTLIVGWFFILSHIWEAIMLGYAKAFKDKILAQFLRRTRPNAICILTAP